MMKLIAVKSSNITHVGHDPLTKVLHVKFHSGAVHAYKGVSAEQAHNLLGAPSVGRHFNQHIKDAFPNTKIA